MTNQFYHSYSSPFGSFTILWKENRSDFEVKRIFLSDPSLNSEEKAFKLIAGLKKNTNLEIDFIGEKIRKFLNGKIQEFNLDYIDINQCYESQRKVLLAEYNIPRGWVSTYKRIAINIGITNGARVVGNALAKNPFPIVIPCHRAIKSNGELGGFQGGTKMKRALLELEGVEFSETGKVVTKRIFY
jgi:methylated-DNA-[protein]-cysteine S-methyltransferase